MTHARCCAGLTPEVRPGCLTVEKLDLGDLAVGESHEDGTILWNAVAELGRCTEIERGMDGGLTPGLRIGVGVKARDRPEQHFWLDIRRRICAEYHRARIAQPVRSDETRSREEQANPFVVA